MTKQTYPRLFALATAVFALVACGSDAGSDAGVESTRADTIAAVAEEEQPVDTTVFDMEPTPLDVSIPGVSYYGACGNETFVLDGVTWYPLADQGAHPDHTYVDATAGPEGLVRVGPPGPGDDVGTLHVYVDGYGRFISDSGTIDLWVVTFEQTYEWVC